MGCKAHSYHVKPSTTRLMSIINLEEAENEKSIDTQPRASIDEKSGATVDITFATPIDSDPGNEIDDFPEGSINSWENDYYQPSFSIHTATPSERKLSAMENDEYDEDYKEEANIEYHGLAMEEEGVLKPSHETKGETLIDNNYKASIDTHHETESDARAETSADFRYLRAYEFGIFKYSEEQARALDGRAIHISKDVADTIAKARRNIFSPQAETED
ncbi:hypothetical protein F2Q70_00011168 [Brassica cretica]|uniref:Uncharacterized protein n=1 Tax=Brassica cretica TaxID=69181 RepID=A0A8S9LZ93_BRACR|nr:hypothetical protein F2Q70_00011168 [Brassica cretica]